MNEKKTYIILYVKWRFRLVAWQDMSHPMKRTRYWWVGNAFYLIKQEKMTSVETWKPTLREMGTKLDFLISSHSTQRKAILYLYEENDIFIYLLYLWIKKMIKQYSMDPSSPIQTINTRDATTPYFIARSNNFW